MKERLNNINIFPVTFFFRFGILFLALSLTGCLEELENNTADLLSSFQRLEQHTDRIAASTEKLAQSGESIQKNINQTSDAIQDRSLTITETMNQIADSLKDFSKVIDMVKYFEKISQTMDKTAPQIQELMERINQLLAKFLGDGTHKDTDESPEEFFNIPSA